MMQRFLITADYRYLRSPVITKVWILSGVLALDYRITRLQLKTSLIARQTYIDCTIAIHHCERIYKGGVFFSCNPVIRVMKLLARGGMVGRVAITCTCNQPCNPVISYRSPVVGMGWGTGKTTACVSDMVLINIVIGSKMCGRLWLRKGHRRAGQARGGAGRSPIAFCVSRRWGVALPTNSVQIGFCNVKGGDR